MKKTNRKHLFRTIKKSGVTFFAVAFIAAVSIAIFHGFQSSSLAILTYADNYFNKNNLESFEVACANGITEEDIEAIAGWEGVTHVEGGYSTSVLMKLGTDRVSIQVVSALDKLNQSNAIEGTLPTSPEQIAVEERMADQQGIQLGDTITLEHDGELFYNEYTVTAIVNRPTYNCVKIKDARGKADVGLGSNDYYIEVMKEAFDPDYYSGCFTAAYVDSSVMDGIFYFDDAYEEVENAYLARLEAPAAERAQNRYDTLMAEVNGELADARAELNDAKKEIADGEAEIADAKKEIADGEKEIADAKKEIADGEKDLADGKKEFDKNKKEFDKQKKTLADAKDILYAELAAAMPTMKPEDTMALLAQNPALSPASAMVLSYLEAEGELEAAEKELVKAQAEIKDAEAELVDGRKELADAEAKLADGKADLADAEKKLTDGKADLAEAEIEFADAEAEVAELKMEDWVLNGRNEVGDVRGIQTIVDMMTGLSYAMSMVFLLVSAVICYASVSRMIDEQRVLMGAQKAIGATPGEILSHFLIYNLFCALLGILIGWVAGIVIVENLILYVFDEQFMFDRIPLQFNWTSALIAGGICLAIFMVSTFLTCRRLVKEPSITLLRGEVPTTAKRRFFEDWGLWKKMSLYNRTMIRNVLSDKGRMMTTIMGVVGCTSLLVSCLMMKMGIENSSIRHFEEYFLYNHRLVVDTSIADPADFATILDGCGVEYTLIHDKLNSYRPAGGSWDNAHVVAATEADDLAGFMVLEDVGTKEVLAVPERGMLVSRRCAERFDLSAGSTVELMDENGLPRTVEIAGVVEHYIDYHLFISSAAYYEEVLGKPVDNCVFLLKADADTLRPLVENMPGFLSLNDNSAFAANADVHNLVIAICTALAGAMALLVLLNQITMCINRKSRELAVMRINGYTVAQTKAYIYKDNIVLTAIGLLLGCVFGITLGYLDIRIIETGASRFVRDPNWIACLIACGICTVFAIGVNILALRRIDKLSLTNVSSN